MATNSTIAPLPNPFTPLAFLPPTLADQFQTSVYLFVGALAAFIWDWLMAIPDEIKMCRKRKLRSATVAYFLSRIGTLGYCTMAVVFQTTPVDHCNTMIYMVGGCYIVAVTSTSALFYFRLKAVYCNNKIVTIVFGSLLFSLFGLSFIIPLCAKGVHIGITRRCINTELPKYVSTPIIVNAIFDTLVFVTISLRIVSFTIVGNTFRARMGSFLRGDGLPGISKSLLQDGQLYYFVTIGLNIVVVVMLFAPVPPFYQAMFTAPNVALESAMACRVFRGVRLGLIKEKGGNTTHDTATTSIRLNQRSHPAGVVSTTGSGYASKSQDFKGPRLAVPVAIEITRTIESGDPFSSPARKPGQVQEYEFNSMWADDNSAVVDQV